MLRRAFIICLFVLLPSLHSYAQVGQIIPSGKLTAGAGVCSQAIALEARMDASENTSAVAAAVCGMVTDGTYSLLDGLYVGAINSSANSLLNWAQNAFNLTQVSTVTFTANQGWTSGGAGYFTTGFIPSSAGGHMTQNSASFGGCAVTSVTTTDNNTLMGASNSGNTIGSFLRPLTATNTAQYFINANFTTVSSATISPSNKQGASFVTRTASGSDNFYKGGTFISSNASATSTGLPPVQMAILATNFNSVFSGILTGVQVAYAFYGGGLTGTQVTAIYNRLHTYLQTVGETTAC